MRLYCGIDLHASNSVMRIDSINRLFGSSQRESRLIGVETCRRQAARARPSACRSASWPRIRPGGSLAGPLLPPARRFSGKATPLPRR